MTTNQIESVTDVDFRFYVQSAHYFSNLQECSAGYWIFIEHFTNVVSIVLSAVTTSELISDNNQILGKSFLPWAGAILTIVNAFKAYMSPGAKAEAHHQTAKYSAMLPWRVGSFSGPVAPAVCIVDHHGIAHPNWHLSMAGSSQIPVCGLTAPPNVCKPATMR